jgi:hypothetical protein
VLLAWKDVPENGPMDGKELEWHMHALNHVGVEISEEQVIWATAKKSTHS